MPDLNQTWARGEALASAWVNSFVAFVSSAAPNFALQIGPANTQLEVVAAAGGGLVAVSIEGRWRWVEATVTRAHPGGAAGTYDVYATAADDSISNSPDPWTDNTNRAFALAIVAAGATPTVIPGMIDIYRKVGACQWDGAKITAVWSTVPLRVPDPVVTSLPVAPYDGQVIHYLADAARGVEWRLCYRAASTSAHKWEFVGGPSAMGIGLGDFTLSAAQFWTPSARSAAYTNSGSFGQAPLPGDYLLEYGSTITIPGNMTAWVSVDSGAGAADADAFQFGSDLAGSASPSRQAVHADIAAGSALRLAYRDSGALGTLTNSYLRITPIRVG